MQLQPLNSVSGIVLGVGLLLSGVFLSAGILSRRIRKAQIYMIAVGGGMALTTILAALLIPSQILCMFMLIGAMAVGGTVSLVFGILGIDTGIPGIMPVEDRLLGSDNGRKLRRVTAILAGLFNLILMCVLIYISSNAH
jgi:hypothetical protein